jgi:hypothetical protein
MDEQVYTNLEATVASSSLKIHGHGRWAGWGSGRWTVHWGMTGVVLRRERGVEEAGGVASRKNGWFGISPAIANGGEDSSFGRRTRLRASTAAMAPDGNELVLRWTLNLVYLHTGWRVMKAGWSRTEEALAHR